MTDKGPCPPAPDLLDLVSPASAAGAENVRRHVAGCTRCEAELSQLRAGFQAASAAAWPVEAAALRRIEAEVMAVVAHDLTAAEVARPAAAPLAPESVRPRLGRLWGAGLLAAATVVGVALGLAFGHGGPGLEKLPLSALALVAVPVLLLPALRLPRRGRRSALCVALGVAGLAPLLAAQAWDWAPVRDGSCLLFQVAGLALPAFLLPRAAGALGRDRSGAALLGTAVMACGLLAQSWLCGSTQLSHLMMVHLLPFGLGVAAFVALLSRGTELRSGA